MPMRIPPSIETDPGRIATSEILGILQREQDHAVALLSSSPLLSSLFVSYASRAVALEATSSALPTESEERKLFQATVTALQEENERLKSDNLELTRELEAAVASREAFRSQASSLMEVNTIQQGDIQSLRADLVEVREKYDRFVADSNIERAALQIKIFDLEVEQGELKRLVAEQQIKTSKLERQDLNRLSDLPSAAVAADPLESEQRNAADGSTRTAQAEARARQEAKEKAKKAARERADRAARRAAIKELAEKAERRANEKTVTKMAGTAARRAIDEGMVEKAGQKAKEKTEKEKKNRAEADRITAETKAKRKAEKKARQVEQTAKKVTEREAKKKAKREAKEKAKREEKERFEREERIKREDTEKTKKEAKEETERETPSAWGSTVGKNDHPRKASGLSHQEQKSEGVTTCGLSSIEKGDPPDLPPVIASSTTRGDLFDSAGNFNFFVAWQKDLPGGAEVEFLTPLTEKGADNLPSVSKAVPPTKTTDVRKIDALDLNVEDVSVAISISSGSESECWTDAGRNTSPTEPPPPGLTPETASKASSNTTPESPKTPKEVKDETFTTPSLPLSHQSQVPLLAPSPTRSPSLLRREFMAATPSTPAPNLLGRSDGISCSSVSGDAGGGGNAKSIVMPAIPEERPFIFTSTTHDRRKEKQRESDVGEVLGSNNPSRGNNWAQSNPLIKRLLEPSPAPGPPKSSGWESWTNNLLANIMNAIAVPDRSPSPEDTPRWPIPSQPAGFGSSSKPTRSAGGSGDNNAKTSPAPITQKTSTGPALGAKPAQSTFGSRGTSLGSGIGSTSGPGIGKDLLVDTTMKHQEGSSNPAGPENISASATEVKHIPVPGVFNSAVTDEVWNTRDITRGWEAIGIEGSDEASVIPPLVEGTPESQIGVAAEPAKAEAVTPAKDKFDQAGLTKTEKSQVVCCSDPVPNAPDPEHGPSGGGGRGKKKKRTGGR